MRFLVDAQLPASLCREIEAFGQIATHTERLTSGNQTSDAEIVSFAEKGEWIVVSKDTDFFFSHLLFHQPKKLLLVRTGNLRLHQLLGIFRRQMPQIIQAFASHCLVEIDSEQIRLIQRG